MTWGRSLKAGVPLLVLAVLIPVAASAMPPASTSPEALFTTEKGNHWVVSQPAYRNQIPERAIRYDSNWEEQERRNITGLDYLGVMDMAKSKLGSRAVLTDSNIMLYDSEWERQRELEISGSPEFIVSKQENFHVINKVHEGGETNYYLQKISHDLENFSSKKKLDLDLNIKAVDSFNDTWVALSPAPEGAQVTYYSQNWTHTKERDVELPARTLNSELKGLETSNNSLWVMTSEENSGFGGKIHQLTTEPEYTGKYYDIGIESAEERPSVVTTRELPWTLPMLTIAAIVMAMLGLTVLTAIILLLVGPYRTWKKHIKQEEREEEASEKEEDTEE